MKLRRRTLVALVLGGLAVVAGGLVSEGQGRSESTAAPAAAKVSGNLVLAHWASSPVETALLKQVIAQFERRYPDINVRRRALDPYPDSMLAQFAARKPPDVFYVDSNVAPDWIKQGVLEPLNGWINRYKFRTQSFYPQLLNAFKDSKGQIYGFPKDWSPLAMQTNTQMLQRAGVSVPTNWTTLVNAARRLRTTVGSGNKPICIAPDWARLLAFVHQNGGSFLNASKTQATVDTPEVLRATQFYVGLKTSGLAGSPSELGVGWCGEALGKEKAAIVFEGNWVVPYMQTDFPNVRYQNNPMVRNKQPGNLAFTVSYSIAKDSKQKAAAWTLLTYLTGRQGMRTWTSRGLALPSRSDVRPVAGRQAFLSAAGHAKPWQFAPGFAKVITTAGNELTAVFEGKQTIPAMLDKVQAEAEQTLRRGR
jgi:multiple sugar transport system substrate-binding protein